MSDVPFGVWLGREVSARTLLFHGAVAEWMGLNPTDYKVLDILHRAGRMTAGEIAAETGLSTGAVTGVVDRLERGRWAERVKDPDDRRHLGAAGRHPRPPLVGELGPEHPAVDRMRRAGHEAGRFQQLDDLQHRLRGHERAPGQVGVRQPGLALE